MNGCNGHRSIVNDEQREEMMDAAEAIRRANQGSKNINVNHRYYY